MIVNRTGIGHRDVYRFCEHHEIPILAEIPFDRTAAESYARGEIIARTGTERREQFEQLKQTLIAADGTSNCSRNREVHYA